MSNDLTFFTNEPNATLLDRFKATLKDVQYFDVLVGYFRTSGFHLLQEAFEDIEKIRILVGLSVDRKAFEIIETASGQMRKSTSAVSMRMTAISAGLSPGRATSAIPVLSVNLSSMLS